MSTAYYQFLCGYGHYWTGWSKRCPRCGKSARWQNRVGYDKEWFETCYIRLEEKRGLMGNPLGVYRIPKEKGKIIMEDKYNLVVSFQADFSDYRVKEDEVEKLLGPAPGAGLGFGRRDLSYWFTNKRSLYAAVRKVRRMPRKIKCEAWENIDAEGYNQKRVSLRGIR